MLKRFGKGKQPCLTPEHRSEPVSYTASKVDSTGGFVVGVLYNCVQIGSGCQISLLILCKALITASRRAYAMLPTVGYCPISLLRPPPARLGSYQCWLLVGHSVPLGHLRIHGCTVLRSILSTYFECPSCFSHCCIKGVH